MYLYFNFREAGIEARKLSGFAKGYSYSHENPFTINSKTNHAWNAVKINGKWYLLDSTWGSGNVNKNKEYEANFTEYYFLPEPEMLIKTHYPYDKSNMEESEKWQLLEHPVSLEEFNKSLRLQPAAYELGVYPVSHKDKVVSFTNEVELTFKENEVKTNELIVSLKRRQENKLFEEKYSCYMYFSVGLIKLKVKPPKAGKYELDIFGKERSYEGKALFTYILMCTVPSDESGPRECAYPMSMGKTFEDECEILEPLGRPILRNTPITMRFRSAILKVMMVEHVKLIEIGNNIFEITLVAPDTNGYELNVFGAREDKTLFHIIVFTLFAFSRHIFY